MELFKMLIENKYLMIKYSHKAKQKSLKYFTRSLYDSVNIKIYKNLLSELNEKNYKNNIPDEVHI